MKWQLFHFRIATQFLKCLNFLKTLTPLLLRMCMFSNLENWKRLLILMWIASFKLFGVWKCLGQSPFSMKLDWLLLWNVMFVLKLRTRTRFWWLSGIPLRSMQVKGKFLMVSGLWIQIVGMQKMKLLMVTLVLLPKFGIDTHMYLSCSYIRYSLQNIGVLYLFVVATQFNVDKGLNFFAFVGFIFKD